MHKSGRTGLPLVVLADRLAIRRILLNPEGARHSFLQAHMPRPCRQSAPLLENVVHRIETRLLTDRPTGCPQGAIGKDLPRRHTVAQTQPLRRRRKQDRVVPWYLSAPLRFVANGTCIVPAGFRDGLAELERRPGRRIDLVYVVRLVNLDIEIGPEVALTLIACRSEPAPGSDNTIAPICSPLASFGKYRAACSALPKRAINSPTSW